MIILSRGFHHASYGVVAKLVSSHVHTKLKIYLLSSPNSASHGLGEWHRKATLNSSTIARINMKLVDRFGEASRCY